MNKSLQGDARRLTQLLSAVVFCAFSSVAVAESETPPSVPQVTPPDNAPNVVVVLLDDVGFGAASTFGGPAQTSTLEDLAENGLRYNRFHTTAICSPTRASLLTGRDPHVAGVGAVINAANAYPGYRGILKDETATVARMLKDNGYSTAAFGKWHLVPGWEASQVGPFDRWPTGVGFDTFYGFLGGETDQFEPTLYAGTTPVMRPEGENYHVTEDLADQSIAWLRMQNSVAPDKPFFLYFSTGATHAPLQVPEEWIERYKGRFSQGWDRLREEIFERQKHLGVIPEDTELTPRPEAIPAWETLTEDEQKVAERLMETFAAFLAHTDAQVGRLVQALKDSGQYENTLFVYIVGDNGSEAAGGIRGSVNYMGQLQGLPESTPQKLKRLDDVGGPDSYPQYPVGWGWSLTTPFQWLKKVASHLGGTRNPMVVTWPQGIEGAGGLRSQFSHVNDIAPTILDAVGLDMPRTVDGVEQLPMDGSSLLASFANADAPEHHTTQYFEVYGHRAIYHEGWMASAFHDRLPWTTGGQSKPTPFEDDTWELYNLEEDFSQANDLAEKRPEKLAAMKALFHQEAERVGILPLRSSLDTNTPMPNLAEGRTEFTYYPGTVAIPESQAPAIFNRSWTMTATLEVPTGDAKTGGVLATMGGTAAGWSLYLDAERRPVFRYRVFEVTDIEVGGNQPLAPGRQTLRMDFDYDGGGYGKGGTVTLSLNDQKLGSGRLPMTPPAFFSIDETFDVGLDTGSPAGDYPADAELGYPISKGILKDVRIELR